MTTSPVCRCLSCGRLFCYVPGFTPTRTRCYLCGPEPHAGAGAHVQHEDEGQGQPIVGDSPTGQGGEA